MESGPTSPLDSPPAPAPVEPAPTPPRPSRITGPLSPVLTGVMAVILLSGILLVVWLQLTIPRVERVAFPERALPLMVGRDLDIAEAIGHTPWWERWLYAATTDAGRDTLEEAIGWYREVQLVAFNPELHLELAILLGEAGHRESLEEELNRWTALDDPLPQWADLVRLAYLEPTNQVGDVDNPVTEVAEALPAGWFLDRITTRLAARTPRVAPDGLVAEREARYADLLSRVRLLTGVELCLILSGGAAWLALKGRASWRIGAAAVPPRWRGRDGMVVLVWGGALGLLAALSLLFVDPDHPAFRLLSMPVAALPVVLMARRYLLLPHGIGIMRGFGLRVDGVPRRLWLAVLLILSAGFLGEWVLGILAEQFHVTSHWTEWFDADLVWGDPGTVAVSLIEFVLFAPVFEELVFRGLLFGTLRRRFAWPVAALMSAGVFALAHGYGLLGLLSVLWSGLLWAWIYEKTGSLLPSITAHAINNLLVCVSLIALLR